MLTEQPKKSVDQQGYNLNLKIIMLLVAAEVLILVSISFIKIYVDKKQSIIRRINDEVQILERVFIEDLDYSNHVLNQISDLIKRNYHNVQNINNILANYTVNNNVKNFFGWQGFYWLDRDSIVAASNNHRNIIVGSNLSYLNHIKLSRLIPERPFYGLNPASKFQMNKLLNIAVGLTDPISGEYIGSLLLEINTGLILKDLEKYRKNYTNFAIVDSRLNVITSYPVKINRLGISREAIHNTQLTQTLEDINFFAARSKEVSYLEMLNGSNYYAKKIKNKPFTLIVSIDPGFIKSIITQRIAIKFLEIAILASFFLVLVISIYKKETWLRAKAEKASQLAIKATNAKTDFLSYTAHEIRSPLGFILTGSEIMSKKLFGPWPEAYEDYVNGIHHNAKAILEFINDILDEQHIVSGNFKVEETICRVEEIIDKAIMINRTRFHERKINIRSIVNETLPALFIDDRRILQALNNLISNAYKYSLDNTEILVDAKVTSQGKMQVTISDQGIGMSAEEIKIALTKYGTVHANRSTNWIESYGLGLTIVEMLLKSHDAELSIKSKVNIGTKVTITFPAKRVVRSV